MVIGKYLQFSLKRWKCFVSIFGSADVRLMILGLESMFRLKNSKRNYDLQYNLLFNWYYYDIFISIQKQWKTCLFVRTKSTVLVKIQQLSGRISRVPIRNLLKSLCRLWIKLWVLWFAKNYYKKKQFLLLVFANLIHWKRN